MSNAITWVHDEMLSPAWQSPETPSVFIFDEQWIETEQISLKRIVFMYECLLEMPGVEIRKGNVVAEVTRFAQEHHATRIVTARSPLPRLKRQGAQLATQLTVDWIDPEPIVTLPEGVDLKRFSRYWRRAEKQVLRND
ncbi:hypothetical protein Pla123a_29750 [Posidoniimonas polymericola]|uniref:Uncharacterized protein n=1 Tax=Posidoniimonas polymericola TaxID=2528002 RepID=A0A5C5YKR7_9BACT|nr:deoxyribodipyrimidine photo-lyase [Posidoniimonas polymericola]TWT75466.1 hypothetical protein Pla123a_29750 [Posidoniimonas polymericola]